MELVEEIIDDYAQVDQQQTPSQDQDSHDLVASHLLVKNDISGHVYHNHEQQQLQDHGHHRARSMPSLSSEETQQLQQQIAMATFASTSTTTVPTHQEKNPSRARPLRRPESMMISSTSKQHSSLPSRRVTLNPGAALSTSALQSMLQLNPQEQSSSAAKAERSKKGPSKAVSMGFVNTNKWASRGGIGQKNEMMVDLETPGVFVPETGRRLRPEFVYNITTQCADEIRLRGLTHPNLFQNPAPKKVINSMISLLTDRQRCELFSIKCMRIDTVASLLLNTISRMSNPIIPYDMMDYFYGHQFTLVPAAPHHPDRTDSSSSSSSSCSFSSRPASMAMTPSSSPRNSVVSPPSSALGSPAHSNAVSPWSTSSTSSSPSSLWYHQHPFYHYQQTTPFSSTWARHYFDLPLFLESLPAINRSILLEVLHLCQEVLEHSVDNLATVGSLSQVISTALFSSVFDHKLLDRMAGIKRASIHGDGISAMEGVKQECQMFSAILIRFLVMTDASGAGAQSQFSSPSASPAMMNTGVAEMIHHQHHSLLVQPTMLLTPMSSAATSTTSIASGQPHASSAEHLSSSATTNYTTSPNPRVTNRLSCPNLMTGFGFPVSAATAKRTSMSPRPYISEIRGSKGMPVAHPYHHQQQNLQQPPYFGSPSSLLHQADQDLDLKRQSMPPSAVATAHSVKVESMTAVATGLKSEAEEDEGEGRVRAADNGANKHLQPMTLRPLATKSHPAKIVVSAAPTPVSSKTVVA
ncbi:hypothetical protein BGZ73_009176 [Actinomortierella ambigua]|nr:hypothetical protein BGZ73_009176 [Actinomortierella ambigua]